MLSATKPYANGATLGFGVGSLGQFREVFLAAGPSHTTLEGAASRAACASLLSPAPGSGLDLAAPQPIAPERYPERIGKDGFPVDRVKS